MLTSSILLESIQAMITRPEGWEKEVRYNWLRQFAMDLLCLTHPEFALQYFSIAKAECHTPKGILAIETILKNMTLNENEKIAAIKGILLAKGYDGEKEKNNWKRTEFTHTVYCQLIKAIIDYQKSEPGELNEQSATAGLFV